MSKTTTRVLFALPGLHCVNRGAETAFESVAAEVALIPGFKVTVMGGGEARADDPYQFMHVPRVPREKFEKWPGLPVFRSHYSYEDATFAANMLRVYRPKEYDVTVTANFPFTNGLLRARKSGGKRPAHVFVTQNGDWMVGARTAEYRFFGCDGLVCTNNQYFARHASRFPSRLIPNGVDPRKFFPGKTGRTKLGLPENGPLILMVSALIASKYPLEGIEAASRVPGANLVIAGDGELRQAVRELGEAKMGDRFRMVSVPRAEMPALYRAADLFLHMSRGEASANVYIEALATGLPVITHDWEVTRWTFDGQASLVDTANLDLVATALQNAVAGSGPGSLEGRVKLAGERFDWRVIAATYAEFFRELTGGQP